MSHEAEANPCTVGDLLTLLKKTDLFTLLKGVGLGPNLTILLVDILENLISVTPLNGGFSVQVFATVSPDSGQIILEPPTCELFVSNVPIASQSMIQVLGPLWMSNFTLVSPHPQVTKVSATFLNYGTFETSTQSDVALIPQQQNPGTLTEALAQAGRTAALAGDFTVKCKKKDNKVTVTAEFEAGNNPIADPMASLYYFGSTKPVASGPLAYQGGTKYSATFAIKAQIVEVEAHFDDGGVNTLTSTCMH